MGESSKMGRAARVKSAAPTIEVLAVRTPTLPPATHTNTFLVGTGQAVLVEPATPYQDEQDVMVEWVESARARGVEPIAILATHHHPDHIGGAGVLRNRLGLPLWGHAMTAQRLSGVVEVDRLLEDGERIELDGPTKTALTAVHTPGHAPGHLCFVDEASGIMIAGDMVASIGTIIVEPIDGDMILYLDSLRRIASLEPVALLPAHGDIIGDPQAILRFYIAHRLMREGKVLDALEAHGQTARPDDLVARAYDDTPEALWPLAIRSIEAHLIKLEREGRITSEGGCWLPPAP
ncbi:MAG: MBL fold metallo-hydrolase [Deltaproteobacteria bacterium]|nr:MBL fold metallo-hydrolase [Deltaproteobacteria bacterium]